MCLAKRGALFWRASCPLWLAGPAVTHTGCKRHQGSSQDRQKTASAWGLGSSAHQPLSFSSWNSPITTLFLWECLYPQNLIGFFCLSSHICFFSRNKRFVNLGLSEVNKAGTSFFRVWIRTVWYQCGAVKDHHFGEERCSCSLHRDTEEKKKVQELLGFSGD